MPLRRRSDSHPPRRDPVTEAIAWRAFELFLARGQQDGHDLDDWLQAEREFMNAASRGNTATESESWPPDESAQPEPRESVLKGSSPNARQQ
jgi:hypothetical protein